MHEKEHTIFVIDDNEIDGLIAKIVIEKAYPCSVHSFTSAQKALSVLKGYVFCREKSPDMILLDLDMPLKSGWDFLEEYAAFIYKKAILPIPVYVLSCSINPLDELKAQAHPLIEGMISKPFTAEVIQLLLSLHTFAGNNYKNQHLLNTKA